MDNPHPPVIRSPMEIHSYLHNANMLFKIQFILKEIS